MKYTVYAIHPVWVDKEDITNYYIGMTDNLERRWKSHERHARNGTRNQYVYQQMRQTMTMVTVLKEFDDIDEAYEWIGKTGTPSGNIAKQSAKGRPAYGYYWIYD